MLLNVCEFTDVAIGCLEVEGVSRERCSDTGRVVLVPDVYIVSNLRLLKATAWSCAHAASYFLNTKDFVISEGRSRQRSSLLVLFRTGSGNTCTAAMFVMKVTTRWVSSSLGSRPPLFPCAF